MMEMLSSIAIIAYIPKSSFTYGIYIYYFSLFIILLDVLCNIQALHVSGSAPGSRAMDDCLLDATPCDFYFLYFEAMSICLMPLSFEGDWLCDIVWWC